jgi:hypothetical protein
MENVMKSGTSLIVALCLALVLVLAATFKYGRDAHARLEQAEAATSEEETRAFCRDLGFAPESQSYAHCRNGLQEMKQRLRERWEADAAGML